MTPEGRQAGPERRAAGARWSACWQSAGRPNRSRSGSGSIIRMIRRCGCRTRRSTSRCSCRPAARCAGSWPRLPAHGSHPAPRAGPSPSAGADPRHGPRSASGRPRSRTGRCPATGRATSSSAAQAARRSRPWSSARPATCCWSALPHGRTAELVRDALAERILTLPDQLRRSLTWDRARRWPSTSEFTIDTGVQVYFCDPHSPWQRGSNENTNGLLRQYFPKSTDLSVHDQAHLDDVARQLNGRPRQTLGWMKPSEALAKLVALTG